MALSDILVSGFNCFHMIPRYNIGDEVITSAIEDYPMNTSLAEVFKKVVLINSIYGTAIYNTFKIAEHICRVEFDTKIQNADASIIDDIRSGHNILTRNNNQRDLYSFATKYSNWHSQESFPIYDNLVKRLLPNLNNNLHFHNRFTQSDLDNYATLKSVIDSLIEFTNLQDYRYKRIDKGLWLLAKYTYKRNELDAQIIQVMSNVIENDPI